MKTQLKRIASALRPYFKFIVFAVVLIGFMAWASGSMKAKVKPGVVPFERGAPVPAGAETFSVAVESVVDLVDIVGTVASEENIHTSSRLSAYVKAVHVAAGQAVKKDERLVTLDDREIREELAAAEAQLNQAKTEFERTRVLSERDAATAQALIAAESAYNTARAQVDRIKVMLTYTELRSPIDGMVTDTRIEAGDLASPGQVLLSVYNPLALRLEVPVPVRLAAGIALGQQVTLTFDAPPGPHTGQVTEIVGEIDPASRSRLVKVHIDDPGPDLLPGTFGRLWVPEGARPGVQVPASAVYRIGQLEMAQVVENGRALRRLVRTGRATGDRLEVLSGLGAGDVVLVNPDKGPRP